MDINEFELLFGDLRRLIRSHYTFIDKHIPARFGQRPSDYNADVRAYCILCVASFEYYFESLAIMGATRALQRFKAKGEQADVVTRLVELFPATSFAKNFPARQTREANVTEVLEESLQALETLAAETNHGIGVANLKKLLWPLNQHEIVGATRYANALERLKAVRGEYAHKPGRSTIPPEQALALVQDCLECAHELQQDATRKFYRYGRLDLNEQLLKSLTTVKVARA